MQYELIEERDVAVNAALSAGILCSKIRSEMMGGGTVFKDDKSPVTVADFSAQAIICKMINDAFPNDSIVGEEDASILRAPESREALTKVQGYVNHLFPDASEDDVRNWIDLGNGKSQGRYWTLDPIDGTKGFIRGDQYAVALALMENDQIKIGILVCPNLPVDQDDPDKGEGVLFVAVRGEGAEMVPMKDGVAEYINVSNVSSTSDATMVEGVVSGHGNHRAQSATARKLDIKTDSLRMDSQAKYGAVARGDVEIYLRMPSPKTPDYKENIWDHAAGVLIVEEAGGKVTDIDGKSLDFSKGTKLYENRGVVVSNGRFHDEILRAIRSDSQYSIT